MIRERSKTRIKKLETSRPGGNGKEIPIAENAQSLFEEIWVACVKYVGSDTSRSFKSLIYGALGDSLAFKSKLRRKTIELKDMERVVEILGKKGIII